MRRMVSNLYRHDLVFTSSASGTDTKKYYFSVYSFDSTPITIDVFGKYLNGANGVLRDHSASPAKGPTFYAITGTQKSATEVTSVMYIDGVQQTSLSIKFVADKVKVM